MATTALPYARLAEPGLRRSVTAVLRRRVGAADAEDLTQTVLCEALTADRLPEEPAELRRFVVGIARHKAADFHRQAFRTPKAASETTEIEKASEASFAATVEARALLVKVAESADLRDRETLQWIVREHDGEPLQTIARAALIAPAAVRQRVSRLRRLLRARWAGVLAIVLVFGGWRATHPRAEAIVADATGDGTTRALGLAQGDWRVTTPIDGFPDALTLHVTGREVEVFGARRQIEGLTRRVDGGFDFTLRDDRGGLQHATAYLHGRDLDLDLHDGRLHGKAHAERQ